MGVLGNGCKVLWLFFWFGIIFLCVLCFVVVFEIWLIFGLWFEVWRRKMEMKMRMNEMSMRWKK